MGTKIKYCELLWNDEISGYPVNISQNTWELIFSKQSEFVKEFQWTPQIKQVVDKKLVKARTRYKTIVGIHVRRTDYHIYLVDYYGTFNPATASYYNKAMNDFR